jgi:hypothetical protein
MLKVKQSGQLSKTKKATLVYLTSRTRGKGTKYKKNLKKNQIILKQYGTPDIAKISFFIFSFYFFY